MEKLNKTVYETRYFKGGTWPDCFLRFVRSPDATGKKFFFSTKNQGTCLKIHQTKMQHILQKIDLYKAQNTSEYTEYYLARMLQGYSFLLQNLVARSRKESVHSNALARNTFTCKVFQAMQYK